MPSKSQLMTAGLALVVLAAINNFAPQGVKRVVNGS